ncbi:MAG: hypothetical protein ACJA0S_001230 [Rickettsiales bacterium]
MAVTHDCNFFTIYAWVPRWQLVYPLILKKSQFLEFGRTIQKRYYPNNHLFCSHDLSDKPCGCQKNVGILLLNAKSNQIIVGQIFSGEGFLKIMKSLVGVKEIIEFLESSYLEI